MATLELRNLVKHFGEIKVVQNLNLSVAAGEFVVLLGESGCGKSTTLRMIAGLEAVTSGQILIADRDVTHLPPMTRDIAMVFQNYALYPHMNVAQNMSFALRMAGRPPHEIENKVVAAAKVLDMEHLLSRKPKELSGGQRQRVAIGRAIVREPQVFLFDEPLSNLDARLRAHMRAELAQLHERLGKTTFYVTHDQVEAMTLADRIVVMDKGKIQQVGSPSEVFNRPANLFVAGFIGTPSMNFLEMRYVVDGSAGVLCGDGFEFPAPRWLQQLSLTEQQALTVGIRPQTLRIASTDDALTIEVDVVEYLGTESQVVGHLPTPRRQRISVMLPGNAKAVLHQTLSLTVDSENVHVFDRASGQSLCP